ncbi:hypothetical protein EYF80_017536 [Liparis tanakae]|uniref:Uncharacterized protein n=1 Tax=Liparis tanakae TaxID=230148 RepID=A0A4Z2I4S1_9TELE|nr:hypothetical protein EYF80_017536 [Liparis tanakae]
MADPCGQKVVRLLPIKQRMISMDTVGHSGIGAYCNILSRLKLVPSIISALMSLMLPVKVIAVHSHSKKREKARSERRVEILAVPLGMGR